MAEPTPTPPADPGANPPAPTPPANPGSDPAKNPPAGEPFDPSKLSDEDFNKLYEDNRLYRHPRFKSLSERAKKADDLEKAEQDKEKKRLEEQGEFKTLAEKAEERATAAEKRANDLALKSVIQTEAAKLGIADVEAAAILVDHSKITVAEDGTVSGADEALKALLEAKPYLKGGTPNPPSVGSGSNPSPGQTPEGTKRFKLSQIQDHKFFMENEKDIAEAMKLGLIEDDTRR